MGYDVTFHPIAIDELRRFVFDIIENPALAAQRASEISSEPAKRRGVERVYENLANWAQQLEKGQSLALNETYAYAAAQIAGFLHPFWYARNAAISMLDDAKTLDLFVPLTQLPDAPAQMQRAGPAAHIGLNYSASGVITEIEALESNLQRLGLDGERPMLFTVFDGNRLASLREAIAYCKQRDLALLEAADIVIPVSGDAATDPDHYREAASFDKPSSGPRNWYEPPVIDRPPAYEALQTSNQPLANDTVIVKRLFGRNRTATYVPLYLVPGLDRRKHNDNRFVAALYDDGRIEPVRRRSLETVERASSHQTYWRRLYDFERSYYEERAAADPQPDIEAAKRGIGDIPERILDTGLTAAAVGEWDVADALFGQATKAADIIIADKHAERDDYHYPGNLAKVLRTKWLADGLRRQHKTPDALAGACDLYVEFTKSVTRSQWDQYRQRDYLDFALTSLVAGQPDRALDMLQLERPFDEVSESLSLYRAIATADRGSASASLTSQKCLQMLEVIRHPHGGRFLLFGRLTGVQLALAIDEYLVEDPIWPSIRDVANWLGR